MLSYSTVARLQQQSMRKAASPLHRGHHGFESMNIITVYARLDASANFFTLLEGEATIRERLLFKSGYY